MKQQGDRGQATELAAHEHQGRNRKKKNQAKTKTGEKQVEKNQNTKPAGRPAQEFTVAGKKFSAPAGWKKQQPASNMRKAQFQVGQTEIVYFYFGAGQGGSTQANVDRWMRQFKDLAIRNLPPKRLARAKPRSQR